MPDTFLIIIIYRILYGRVNGKQFNIIWEGHVTKNSLFIFIFVTIISLRSGFKSICHCTINNNKSLIYKNSDYLRAFSSILHKFNKLYWKKKITTGILPVTNIHIYYYFVKDFNRLILSNSGLVTIITKEMMWQTDWRGRKRNKRTNSRNHCQTEVPDYIEAQKREGVDQAGLWQAKILLEHYDIWRGIMTA